MKGSDETTTLFNNNTVRILSDWMDVHVYIYINIWKSIYQFDLVYSQGSLHNTDL